MADTKYSYTVSTDFPNGAVAAYKLVEEIRDSSITVAVDRVDVSQDVCDVWFKAALSTDEEAVLNGLIAAHDGVPLPAGDPKTPSGIPLVVPEPREGSSVVIVTHNWCDRCTWYGDSVRVTGETLTDSGDGLTFNSAHQHWIDLIHGRMYAEDKVNAPYLPKIYVEGVEMTERVPWTSSGGDFQIDYETGKVTFFSSQTGKTITADYSYENGSTFYIRPESGKKLQIEKSEVQFSQDVNMTDTINFQAWAYNPADPLNKVPAQAATVYKHIRDFVDEAEGVYPTVPALGGSSGRGLTQQHIVFPFNYKTVKQLYSSMGLEIRIWLSGHQAFGGEFATASFYCVSEDE